jgi:phosphatidylglycerophosphate synthase
MRVINLPHVLSASRFALAALVSWAMQGGHAAIATTGFVLAVASDVIDGRIARGRGEVSGFGTLLDHGADAFFVVTVCATAAGFGLVPTVLPCLIALAFTQYAWSAGRGAPPRASMLGRCNGIAYYVVAGVAIATHHLLPVLVPVLTVMAWTLVTSSLISIVQRARSA